MIAAQIIQETIESIQEAVDVRLCVLDMQGKTVASVFEADAAFREQMQAFLHARADSQTAQDGHFFRVYDGQTPVCILAVQGSGAEQYVMGKMAVCQLKSLIKAYQNKDDEEYYQKALLHGTLSPAEYERCVQVLKLKESAYRAVFLIETRKNAETDVAEILRTLYADTAGSYVLTMSDGRCAVVRELDRPEPGELEKTAYLMVDMVNTEAMVQARVGYGSAVQQLEKVEQSFWEAEMALNVGEIFYSNRKVLSHRELGIGGLIYQMPESLCESFLEEVFSRNGKMTLDEDTLNIVYRFFGNNLNLSETSRQLYMHRNTLVYRLGKLQKQTGLDIRSFDDALVFRIALMVMDYLEYKRKM